MAKKNRFDIFKPKPNKSKFSRPDNAANTDNMDDYNIVHSTALREGSVEHTPTEDSHIANKKYVDDNAGGGSDNLWLSGGGFIYPTDESKSISGATINDFSNDVHADNVHEQIRNESGGTLNPGDAVFISGFNVGLNRTLVDLADATDSSKMPAVGLISEQSLANNETGEMIEIGVVEDVDTNSFEVGDDLFVSTAGTTGNTLTTTPPTGPNEIVQEIGHVLRKNASSGIIEAIGGHDADVPNTIDIPGSISGSGIYTNETISGANAHMSGTIFISAADDGDAKLQFQSPGDSTGARISYNLTSDLMTIGTQNTGSVISFESSDGVQAIYIDGNQRIGIGTNNPIANSKLDLRGNFQISGGNILISGGGLISEKTISGAAINMTGNISGAGIFSNKTISGAKLALSDAMSGTHIDIGSVSGGKIIIEDDFETLSGAYVANVIFGTGAVAPTATGFTRGSIYIQYTP